MRILITGPECTGKSTLATDLGAAMNIPVFPEYARTYLEENGPAYTQADLLHIARQHHHLVHIFPSDQALILDTYLLNLKIWSQDQYGTVGSWISESIPMMHFDHILLCYPDLPWQEDGLRENENRAMYFFDTFQKELEELNQTFHIVKGQGTARLQSAIKGIKEG